MHHTRLAMEGKACTRNVWILITIFFLVKVQGQDPCDSYLFLNDTTMLTSYTNSTTNCTRQRFLRWYRFGGNPDGLLSNVCPQDSQCGTTNKRVWMNGTIPSITDNSTEVSICMADQGNCCSQANKIEIKNCTDFIVINLSTQQPCTRLCFQASNTTSISDITMSPNMSTTALATSPITPEGLNHSGTASNKTVSPLSPTIAITTSSSSLSIAPTTSSLTTRSQTVSPTEPTTALDPSMTPSTASPTNETFTTSEPLTTTTAYCSSSSVFPEVVLTSASVLFVYLCCGS